MLSHIATVNKVRFEVNITKYKLLTFKWHLLRRFPYFKIHSSIEFFLTVKAQIGLTDWVYCLA